MLRGALKHTAVHLNHITWLFDNISHNISHQGSCSHTVCEKTAIHSLVCLLRSLLLTTFSVIVQTSSTIRRFFFSTEWPGDYKTE